MNAFEEYLHSEDLEKRERAQLWRTSIGLQDVDNLRVSNFLIETARKYIEGDISIDEVSRLIDEHYKKEIALHNRRQDPQFWMVENRIQV